MINRLVCIYFSATDTTRQYVKALSESFEAPVTESINLADNIDAPIREFAPGDLLILAAPVYGGRLPVRASLWFKQLRGKGAKAIAVTVFGNRNYDDALLEMTDILSDNGFIVIGAGAFVAQHSIFPKVAASRPDSDDIQQLNIFASQCKDALSGNHTGKLAIKGNRPYKKIAGVGLSPVGDTEKCNLCGKCAEKCPVGAIDSASPCTTAADICISCGRCIHVCPRKARHYKGVKYNLIGAIFTAAFSRRKAPEFTTL